MGESGSKPVFLGFLTVRDTPHGLRGGYLLTSEYGRPIEFHYTSELRIGREQRLLYGKELEPYVHSEVIGKPLTDRQSSAPRVVLVDLSSLLDLRRSIPAPVVKVSSEKAMSRDQDRTEQPVAVAIECHPEFPDDRDAFERIQALAASNFDWLEPFDRLEKALAEIHQPKAA